MNETRIDRNIVDNILDLRHFDKDAQMIKMVIFFFAWKYQDKGSLFDNETLDVDQFCKLFSLKRENVIAKHPNPSQIQALSSIKLKEMSRRIEENPNNMEVRFFDSYLENALFRLFNENIVFSGEYKTYKSENGDTNTVFPLERIIFLSSLSARHITTKKGRKKIVYDYKLNEDFKKNLSLYFSNISINHFVALRKAQSEDLYVYLKNLKDTLASRNETCTATVQFDYLCEIANIQIVNPADRKKKLIQKFAHMAKLLNFAVELSFKRDEGQRWAYTPVINFPITSDNSLDRNTQRKQILLQNFLSEITTIIKKKYPTRPPQSEDFHIDIIQFCRTDVFMDEKIEAYKAAQIKSFVKPDANFMSLMNLNSIPTRLLTVRTIDDILNIITVAINKR